MAKILEQVMKSFSSLLREKLEDYGLNILSNITNSKSTLETLERNLKLLCSTAFDVEEEIKNAEVSRKKKRKREVEEWLKHVQVIEDEFRTFETEMQMEGFVRQLLSGDHISKLNARVLELVEQSQHFGELLLNVLETRGESLLTTQLVGEVFQQNLERVWKCLVVDRVSSIGIYGMGGVGKTTLANHINNRLVEKTQECVFWVTVSQVFSIKKLQDEIAHVVGLDLADELDEGKRAARLNQALSQRKNFVLILDDVWKNIDLAKVGDPLSVECGRLMITTRSLEVCRQVGCQEVISIKPLHSDEGWYLFHKKLGKGTILAPQVQQIAMSIAKVCNGLPLGIITIAGSMRGETDIHVWRNALTELQKSVMGHDEMEDQVFKVLRYSFDRLDPYNQNQGKGYGHTTLQLCFLYCSLYPDDHKIQREELVRKFISEELVNKRNSIEAQLDEGHSILNRLVNVSLLESASVFKEGDSVKMHDLVRAMALKITEGKSMVIAGQHTLMKIHDEEEWTKDLEKISLMENGIEEIGVGISPNCPKLSTLLLQKNPLKTMPESFFSQLCGLSILDLSETWIRELPNSLSGLEGLKALLLGGCQKLEYVPYLGKLKALNELDLSGTAIGEVPKGVEKLADLKFLSMNGAKHLEILPTSLLLDLPRLQLLRLPYQMLAQVEEIERLKHLEEFEGRVKDMCGFNRFIESLQSKKHNVSYCIIVGMFKDHLYFIFNTFKRINKLIVYRHDLQKEKDVIVSAEDIQDLEFFGCKGLSNCLLDDLSNPRSLEKLKISHCKEIKCILTYEQFLAPQESKSRFESLEEIKLWGLQDFMGVIYKQEKGAASPPPPHAVFSCLKTLSISECNKMKKPGLLISLFENLEHISIGWCEEIEEIIEVDEAHGRGVGEAPIISLPKLKCLSLIQLPKLKSICKVKMNCGSIKSIILEKCPVLKKLPLYFPPSTAPPYSHSPPALEEIELLKAEKEWWDSLEWEHTTHKHLLQPFLQFNDV